METIQIVVAALAFGAILFTFGKLCTNTLRGSQKEIKSIITRRIILR